MGKVYDFLQCANLTCVDDLSTQNQHSISQSPRTGPVLRQSLTYFLCIAEQEGFSSLVIHAGYVCALEKIVDFARFLCVAAAILSYQYTSHVRLYILHDGTTCTYVFFSLSWYELGYVYSEKK